MVDVSRETCQVLKTFGSSLAPRAQAQGKCVKTGQLAMNKRPSPPLVVGFLSPITCKATYCRTFLQDDSPGLSLKQFSFIQICRC